MQSLQCRSEELKEEQLRLRQVINEKNTADILVGLFARSSNADESNEDPRVEELLRRPSDDIPDSSKVPELPALILPGQHASKKITAPTAEAAKSSLPDDGIDYDLLGKDRSQCTQEELDRIRRERNRMHAKRTRDRKRLFTEQMSEICRQLEEENELLRKHLSAIDPEYVFSTTISWRTEDASSLGSTPTTQSPKILPSAPVHDPPEIIANSCSAPSKVLDAVTHAHIGTLLEAAVAFESPNSKKRPLNGEATKSSPPVSEILDSVARNLVALSDDSSASGESHADDEEEEESAPKRQRVSNISLAVPRATAVGC